MSNSDISTGHVNLSPSKSHDSDENEETSNETPNESHKKITKTKHQESESETFTKSVFCQLCIKMLYLFKEIGLMVLIAFTYAALTNDPPKISKSPPAFPFFPTDSVVTDWYRGQIGAAIEGARGSDITFVMFYAPWDAESQIVRNEFNLAARHLQKQVTFTAVNCWQPGSDCRNQYSKVYNWPVLIVYPPHVKGIQYRGPRTATHMIKFLKAVSRPLIRVRDTRDINKLLATYDAVVIGCVNAQPRSLDYAVLYSTALKFIEKDPFQEVAFAVLTEPKINKEGETSSPTLRLHMWNETLLYPTDGEWKADLLLKWIFKNLHQVTIWVTPSGSKSSSFSNYIQPGPSVILFTPRNPLHSHVDYYDLLREVALEYYNCGERNLMLQSGQVHSRRVSNHIKHKNLLRKCLVQTESSATFPTVITYSMPKSWINISCCDPVNLVGKGKPMQCSNNNLKDCLEIDRFSKILDKDVHISCERSSNLFKTSALTGENDPKSPKGLQKLWRQNHCKLLEIAERIHSAVYSDSITNPYVEKNTNISGLACRTNASLTFVAVDSLVYYHFAERLGININTQKDKTLAVIINDKLETHHVINMAVTDLSLRQFVHNFSRLELERTMQSTSFAKFPYTHVYSQREACNLSELCLRELNNETFLPTIMQPDKAVVVLYYSKQCSFCNGVSYTFLTIARMFSSFGLFEFTRIDGDLNSLPWEYTMEEYPTILFFPAKRKSESRSFPRHTPITVTNLVSFIIANLDPSSRFHVMWIMCNQTKFQDERKICISSLRIENLSLIDTTLREWRNSDIRRKAEMMYQLQQLRNLHLLLAHSPDNFKMIQVHLTRLHRKSNFEVVNKEISKGAKTNHDEF